MKGLYAAVLGATFVALLFLGGHAAEAQLYYDDCWYDCYGSYYDSWYGYDQYEDYGYLSYGYGGYDAYDSYDYYSYPYDYSYYQPYYSYPSYSYYSPSYYPTSHYSYQYPSYSYPSYGYGGVNPYNYSYPVPGTNLLGERLCYWEGYGVSSCDYNPHQWIYDPYSGTWY